MRNLTFALVALFAFPALAETGETWPNAEASWDGGSVSGDTCFADDIATTWGNVCALPDYSCEYVAASTAYICSNQTGEVYRVTDGATTIAAPGPVLVGADASLTDFPSAKMVVSGGDSGDSTGYIVGLVGEGVSDGAVNGQGVRGTGVVNGVKPGYGVFGKGTVTNTADGAAAYGGQFVSPSVHAGGINIGVALHAANGASNWAIYMTAGDIYSEDPQDWDLPDNNASALSFDADGAAGILELVTTNGAEGVNMGGTLTVDGMMTATGEITLPSSARIGIGGFNYSMNYNGGTEFRLRSTNVDGSGTDGNIFSVQDGTDDIAFAGEASIGGVSADGAGKAVCIKADGNLGTCTDAVGAGGTCTCN